MKLEKLAVVCLLFLTLTQGGLTAQTNWVFTDLNPSNSAQSFAFAVNDGGVVAGQYFDQEQGKLFAAKWTSSGVIPLHADSDVAQASGINNDGWVVGYSYTPNINGARATLWKTDQPIILGSLRPNDSVEPNNSMALDINNNGVVVGQSHVYVDPEAIVHELMHAFKWTEAGGMVDLGTLEGDDESVAKAINDHGVAAGCSISDNGPRAVKWLADGAIELITLPGFGCAYGINNDGAIVGFYQTDVARPFLIDPAGNLTTLDHLGGYGAVAMGINNQGVIVGYAVVGTVPQPQAFQWTASEGTVLLDFPEAFYSQAYAISETTIVGEYSPSQTVASRAFKFTPGSTGNTPAGTGVAASPVDSVTGETPVSITFENVTVSGDTTLTTSAQGPASPAGFKIGTPGIYYNLETTATFEGSATVCINYTGISHGNVFNLKLFHYENGQWVDQTTSLDTVSRIICATVTSFSPFAIFETAFVFNGFFEPVDNGMTNSVKAGSAVPIKFNLGEDKGLGVIMEGYPKSVAVACDSAPVDAVEETVTAGSSSLSYDPLTGQYKYVWKTDKSWTGCRQFLLKLSDGGTYTANFKFNR